MENPLDRQMLEGVAAMLLGLALGCLYAVLGVLRRKSGKVAAAALDLARGTAAIRIGAEGPWDFCRVEGFGDGAAELPSYTDEMAGTHVRWCFGCERYMEHDYLPGGRCRSVWSPRADRVREVNAQYIRLSEGKYLVELDRTPPYRTDTPQGFSKVLLAQDWARLLTVGCIYSPTLNEFRLVSGYAMP